MTAQDVRPGGAEQPGARVGGGDLDVPDDGEGRAHEGHARVLENGEFKIVR